MSIIYEQIGGQEALTAVVDDFYERVPADAELAVFFKSRTCPGSGGCRSSSSPPRSEDLTNTGAGP
jgi:hypothetical protein